MKINSRKKLISQKSISAKIHLHKVIQPSVQKTTVTHVRNKNKVNKKMKTNKHLRFTRGKYIELKKTFPIKIKIIHRMKDYISQVIFAFVLLKI